LQRLERFFKDGGVKLPVTCFSFLQRQVLKFISVNCNNRLSTDNKKAKKQMPRSHFFFVVMHTA
jgi:hypothetical protein